MSWLIELSQGFPGLATLGPLTKGAVVIAMGVFCLALALNFFRLAVGPHIEDRVLALDTLYVNALALTVLLGIAFGTRVTFEAAIVIAMLGFIGTVVVAKYLTQGDIVK